MKYVDIHGHVNFAAFDEDREAVIKRAERYEVGMIVVGTDLETSKKAIELAEKYPQIWATVGLHPNHTDDSFDQEAFKKLAQHPKVVAIGECGLDYYHASPYGSVREEDMAHQKQVFLKHIEIANEVGKPLMLHMRNGLTGQSVYLEAVSILKEHAKVAAAFHFFVGNKQEAQAIIENGGMISLTGVVTFARDYDEMIRNIPLDKILSDTDSPYVAPIPYRGKRNEPSYVTEIIKSLAKIRGEKEGEVAQQLLKNAVGFFKLN